LNNTHFLLNQLASLLDCGFSTFSLFFFFFFLQKINDHQVK